MIESLPNEMWEKYNFFPNYQFSNLGRVKSLERTIIMPNGGIKYLPEKLLTPYQSKNGYLKIGLHNNGTIKVVSIHRIVAQLFIQIPDELKNEPKLQVNHLNEVKTDNRSENLCWTTSKGNCNWGSRNNRISKSKVNGKKSKSVIQYDLQNNLINTFPSTMEIERLFGYPHQNIINCCNGKYKSAYGYIWRYV